MESHLHWADYLILVVFLIISLAIGIYHSLTGGRQKTVAEFIMGNRRLKVIPTAISLFVSFHSAIMYLGITAEMYLYGIQYLIYFVPTAAFSLFVIERIIVPWLFPLKLVSIYEYLEMRFMSKIVRISGASLGISMAIVLMGVAMYAPSAALESATGVPLSVSIPVMAVVTVAYTALGGMRAVIWTDVFQFVTMVVGLVAIFVKGLSAVGGISNVFRLAGEEGRLIWADVSIDPRQRNTVWSLLVGMGFNGLYAFGFTQSAAQRYSAVDRLSKARTTMLILIPPVIIMDIVAGFIGIIVLAYYASIKCDPLANKDIANPNMLLPYFVVTLFADSPGFSGLFLSTLFGATLSTLSSLLSGSAANFWEDILKWKLSHLPEIRKALINKLLVVLFGILIIGVAFLAAVIPGTILQVTMAMFSAVTGPSVAIFVLGGISKHTNWKGALIGTIVGVVLMLWLSIGSMTLHHIQRPLPPVSVEQCHLEYNNHTFNHSSLSSDNFTFFEEPDGNLVISHWNQTTEVPRKAGTQVDGLRGLENFYAISYLWFTTLGAIITGIIAIIVSFIMRDKDLEAKVDARLLMSFRCWGWADENETQEHEDDENCKSLQETKFSNGTEEGFLKETEISDSPQTRNRFHKDLSDDFKKEAANSLSTKDDPDETPGV